MVLPGSAQVQTAVPVERHRTDADTPAPLAAPLNWLMQLAELLLLLGVVHLYDVEGRRQLLPVLGLLFAGSIVHAWLPRPRRMPFFAALSMGTVLFVLGLTSGAAVLAIGGLLIGICYLPGPFVVRLVLLMAAAGALVAFRDGSTSPVWVVLGSMFMFRLAIYLYDTQAESARPPLSQTLSYFFMAPNVCFPFFPVIDYARFRDTYYNENEWAIYQRGTSWMLRGIIHLLAYRCLKLHLTLEPYEIQDVWSAAVFLATNYALYLQVSGQFHLITGILHLFGFNLPRTHDQYFLASSVNDIWRRINIYWKDFLQKLVFLPSFFGLRRLGAGTPAAIVCGVFAVFVGTWLLHSWQAYWLLGAFPLRGNEAALWLGVGVVVAVNSLLEYRQARRRTRRRERPEWIDDLVHAARTAGMFVAVSVFWAAWTRPGFLTQTAALLWDRPGATRGIVLVPACLAGAVLAGAAVRGVSRRIRSAGRIGSPGRLQDLFALHVIAMGAMIAVGMPRFSELLPARAAIALTEFRTDMPMRQDPLAQLQSYYEDLNTVTVQAGPLLRALAPSDASQQGAGDEFLLLTRRADPWMGRELIPGWKGELVGRTVTINQHGIRDRAGVTLRKPADTRRIAVVGSSVIMGYAVEDEDVFDLEFERLLNENRAAGAPHVEVLNFGMGAQGPLQRVTLVERKVLAFQPDAVYYFAHQDELKASQAHLSALVSGGVTLKYPFLEDIVREARITAKTSPGVTYVRLGEPARLTRLVDGCYQALAAECRLRRAVPVWIYCPIPGVPDAPDLADELTPLAAAAGFVTLDLSDWHAGHDPSELKAGAADHHLNSRGHQVLAERLFAAVMSRPEALPGVTLTPPAPEQDQSGDSE